jgi:hypothetical protein
VGPKIDLDTTGGEEKFHPCAELNPGCLTHSRTSGLEVPVEVTSLRMSGDDGGRFFPTEKQESIKVLPTSDLVAWGSKEDDIINRNCHSSLFVCLKCNLNINTCWSNTSSWAELSLLIVRVHLS